MSVTVKHCFLLLPPPPLFRRWVHVLKCCLGWTLCCVRAAECFLCTCRQPYCPVWGWGFFPAGPRFKRRGPRRARPYARRRLFKSLSRRHFFAFFCMQNKKNGWNCQSYWLLRHAWLLSQPQSQTRATLTPHLQQLLFHKSQNVWSPTHPVLFLYQIYLKKAIKTTNNSENNHNCT